MPRGGLWRHPDFLKLWTGQAISEIGSRITRDGLPLAAVIVLGATPAQMGILAALNALATLVFGLAAGLIVDRLRRRPIMIAADLARAAVLATIPLAAFRGVLGMTQLYITASVAGVLTVFFDVAYQSYLPSLVAREDLVEGNARLALTSSLAEIVGPGLTGVLVQLITAPVAILFDAVSFVFSAASVAVIRTAEPAPQPVGAQHPVREAAEGFRAVWRQPILRALALRGALVGVFAGFFSALYSLFAIRDLKMTPASLGLAIAMGGEGNLLGALAARRAAQRFGLGPVFIGTALLTAAAVLLVPLARGSALQIAAMMIAAQFIGDLGWSMYYIHEVSLRQILTPDALLGRVNATMQLLGRGISPFGALAGGALAESIGTRAALLVAVLGISGSIAFLVFSPIRRLRDLHAPAQALSAAAPEALP